MRLLVIGASSFLGAHVRRVCAAAGVSVVASGRQAGLDVRADVDVRAGLGLDVRLDLVSDPVSRIASVVSSAAPDAVVNCAGATSGDMSVLWPANVTAVRRLLTALLGLPSPPRLVHIGSAAEYGPARPGVPLAETATACPAGLYGVTKLAGTTLVELGRAAGLDAVSLRVFNVVGAGAPAGTLPGDATAQLRRLPPGQPGTLRLGPLDGVRDFVDARDVAGAVLAAAAAPSLPHPVINVGSGAGVTSRTLVSLLVAASEREVTVTETAPGPADGGPAAGGGSAADGGPAAGGFAAGGFAAGVRSPARSWQQADIALAFGDLGWRPCRDLSDAVTDLWKGSCLA